jgi:hypothetical protein
MRRYWTPDEKIRLIWAIFGGMSFLLVASIVPLLIIFLSLFPEAHQ